MLWLLERFLLFKSHHVFMYVEGSTINPDITQNFYTTWPATKEAQIATSVNSRTTPHATRKIQKCSYICVCVYKKLRYFMTNWPSVSRRCQTWGVLCYSSWVTPPTLQRQMTLTRRSVWWRSLFLPPCSFVLIANLPAVKHDPPSTCRDI